MRYQAGSSWRDTARPVMLGPINSIAFLPLLLFIFNIQFWTFGLMVLVVIVLQVLDFYGFTPVVFARFLRSTIAGRRRQATPWWM